MTNDEQPKNQRFHMKKNWPILALLVVILVLAIESTEWVVIGGLVLSITMIAIIYFGINNREKGKRKNQPSDLPIWRMLALSTFLTILLILFNEWIVFGSITVFMATHITALCGVIALVKITVTYHGTGRIVAGISLILFILFLCFMLYTISVFAPIRTCHIESSTVASCKVKAHDGFGSVTYRSSIRYWQRNHFAGLIFVGEKFNEECQSPESGRRYLCTD